MSQQSQEPSFSALFSAANFAAPDVEAAVIGAMVLTADSYEQACELPIQAFTDERCRTLFTEACKLYADTGSVDLVSLGAVARRVGGPELLLFLTECNRKVVSPSAAKNHVKTLIDLHQRRLLMQGIGRVALQSLDAYTGTESILEAISETLYSVQPSHGARDEVEERTVVLMEQLKKTLEPDNEPRLSTGIAKIDHFIGGIRSGELIVIGGRPGSGKSGLALTLAQNLGMRARVSSEPDVKGVVFSLEMTRAQIWNRHIAWLTGLNVARFERPDPAWTANEAQSIAKAYEVTQQSGLYIDTYPSYSLKTIVPRIRRLRDKGMQWFIVDYSAKLKIPQARSREEEIGKIACELKRTAKELDVPVIMLHQLSRKSDDRPGELYRPRMSDLRDSGQVEQEADIILLAHRPGEYGIEFFDPTTCKEPTTGMGEVIAEKVRNSETGIARLAFIARCARWEMPAPVDLPEPMYEEPF